MPLREAAKSRNFVLDAQLALKIVRDHSRDLFGPNSGQLQEAARSLIRLRNDHAHNRPINGEDVDDASRYAHRLLRALRLDKAATEVATLSLPPTIAYVAKLRRILEYRAKRRELLTYEQTIHLLGLPETPKSHRNLYRQLNVLAAKQMILGEPQLCALVVLPDSKVPGDGFYWIVDVPADAPQEAKRKAHAAEVQCVFDYSW